MTITPHSDIYIYAPTVSSRLTYVCQWMFSEQLKVNYRLISNRDEWEKSTGSKIDYSNEERLPGTLKIIPHPLLTETGIKPQEPVINRWKKSTILFYNQPGADIPFDIFSAVFYLISRYEEYLPHRKDKHQRYDHQQSVAARFSFLQQPVIDEWIFHFRNLIERRLGVTPGQRRFEMRPTYDIDIAWKYLAKGTKRNWAGYLKDLCRFRWKDIVERRQVHAGNKKDPYDCFDWLNELHRQYQLQPIYFFLLGQWNAFDKNADPRSQQMQGLMRSLSAGNEVGIHPSYGSATGLPVLNNEIALLSQTINQPVSKSRQHFIRFQLPETYEALCAAGITEDYSMGYASCNGFRAGTSHSFLWYNLSKETTSPLRVHPFAFMEATSRFYHHMQPSETFSEWQRLFYAVHKVKGTFISICHNHLISPETEPAWADFYRKTLETVRTAGK